VKLRNDYTCPLEITHDIIKGKWKSIIIFSLRDGEKSLSYLEKNIKGISQKMLLEQLKELEYFGLVAKIKYEGYPLKVGYYLSEDLGMEMLESILIMQRLGKKLLAKQTNNNY
jgi:DNA-binding HxlR family transcriptional regulator